MVRLMFGRRAAMPNGENRAGRCEGRCALPRSRSRPAAARCGGVRRSFVRVATGEILGVAGIDGNGQKQLAEALAGQLPADRRVNHHRGGRRLARSCRQIGAVSGYVTSPMTACTKALSGPSRLCEYGGQGDRQAAVLERRVRANVPDQGPRPGADPRVYGTNPAPSTTPIGHLSGGNIQKVLLGRELSGSARTRGVQQADLWSGHAEHHRVAATHPRDCGAGRRGPC